MLFSIALSCAFVLLLPTHAEGACAEGSLPCDNGQCVRREDWCDGKKTCGDRSDEGYCGPNWWGVVKYKCSEALHWRCEDEVCWPLAARCDGTADCSDGSDEKNCDSRKKEPDGSDEKIVKTDDIKEKSEETKDKDEEDKSKESSGEENALSKESSEEDSSDNATKIMETPSITPLPDDLVGYGGHEHDIAEVPSETIALGHNLPPAVDEFPLPDVSPEVLFSPPTTEMDFYAKKMEQSESKRRYSTQRNVHPTRAYRPPPKRPVAHYPTRSKPAVPYTGPISPYTPRPSRYIGAQYSGQTPSPLRGPYQSPPNYFSGHYYSPDSNHLAPRTNHRQSHRRLNGENWRNGVTRPPRVYERQLRAPSRFYFKKDYNEIYGRENSEAVSRGAEWILSIRNATGGWGKETPRALVALSLVNNSFLAGSYENDLMQKYFQVHLGVNLLRDDLVSLNRLAMFVNALIATCQDPRDFQGWDLTELLRSTMRKLYRNPRPPVINPLVYLSLCLADRNLTDYEVHHLMTYLVATRNDEVTRDTTYLALEAFSCHMQKERHNVAQFYALQKMVWNVTSKILQRRKEDGSFGSVYSTAVAAKALMSTNETAEWDPEPTFSFLKGHQGRNGSFGDFLATYHILPALSGRSLLHLRNTACNPPRVDRELSPQEILEHPGPKSYIRYSLHMGSPLSTGYTVQVLVPNGISFFDVMRVAAHENGRFKFSYEEVNGKVNVYSISDLPNDPEEGLAWRLYITSPLDSGHIPDIQLLYTGDIRELHPTPNQHLIFWYHPLGF